MSRYAQDTTQTRNYSLPPVPLQDEGSDVAPVWPGYAAKKPKTGDDAGQEGTSVVIQVFPQDVFGESSTLVSPVPVMEVAVSSRDSGYFGSTYVFQCSALLMGLCYCLVLYYFRPYAFSLLKIMRSKIYTEKLLDEANHSFAMFLDAVWGLGLLTSAVIVVRAADMFATQGWEADAYGWVAPAAIPVTIAAIALVYGYRWLAIKLAGVVTLSNEFCTRLNQIRKMVSAIFTLLVIPVLLLAALNPGKGGNAMMWIVFAVVAAQAFMLCYKTYVLFKGQKISFLDWFLYLCAVEILPLATIAGFLLRIG